jgi:hypothetical protein
VQTKIELAPYRRKVDDKLHHHETQTQSITHLADRVYRCDFESTGKWYRLSGLFESKTTGGLVCLGNSNILFRQRIKSKWSIAANVMSTATTLVGSAADDRLGVGVGDQRRRRHTGCGAPCFSTSWNRRAKKTTGQHC